MKASQLPSHTNPFAEDMGAGPALLPDLALQGLKVLDFTQGIPGPYCTKLLADLGADVIKVERWDGGDLARRLGPFPGDEPHPEKSGLFLALNTNKRGITLNLKTEAGKKIARRLVAWADLLVESSRPGSMARFGLDWPAARELKPVLVYTSISNFGQTGPYRDYLSSEIIVYAMGGEMNSTGLDTREPLKLGGAVSLFQAGVVAAVATLGALWMAEAEGVGQQVDVSLMEALMASQDRRAPALVAYQHTGEVAQRQRIPSGPVNTVADVAQDPVFNARGAFVEMDHPQAGRLKYPGRPFTMSETPSLLTEQPPDPRARPAPTLGQHNDVVLCGLLGYSREELILLREQGVI